MIVGEGEASGAAFRDYVLAAAEREHRFLDQAGGSGGVHHAAKGFHIDGDCGHGLVLLFKEVLERVEPRDG